MFLLDSWIFLGGGNLKEVCVILFHQMWNKALPKFWLWTVSKLFQLYFSMSTVFTPSLAPPSKKDISKTFFD